MVRVVHFEIPAGDLARARRFYEQTLGWKLRGWGEQPTYLLAATGRDDEPGINGAITPRDDLHASTMTTVAVPDLDACVERVVAAGGRVRHGREPVPGVGWVAFCEDTEGNTFGVLQYDAAVGRGG
jgi:predicted enzyme related to lactoylglutathione lyase